MRITAKCLATTSLVLVTTAFASWSWAAELDATSAIDTVTVYPDGATVTRVIAVDLPSGDSTLIAKDFPLGLDTSSIRVEGEGGAKLTIGTIDARTPRAAPVNLPELDKRIEALNDQRADLQGAIDSAIARRKFAEHFAEASPAGIGDKGEARPIAEWRTAFAAVGDEIASADTAVRDATRKMREIDRQIAQLEVERKAKPPSKLEVRMDIAAPAATKATLRVTYNVRNARWLPLYDARLDTGAKDRKPQLELVRRAEVTQATGEDWSNVALGVSTVRIGRGGSAPELNSLVAQYPQVPKPRALGSVSDSAMPAAAPMQQRKMETSAAKAADDIRERAEEQQAVAEIGDFQATYKIPGRVSLGAAEGAKSLRILDDRARRSHGARGTGDGPHRLPRSELQADRRHEPVAGQGRNLSRRDFRRPRQTLGFGQGRYRAARLRRRRQGQDRARGAQAQRRFGRSPGHDVEDRRAIVQDDDPQWSRLPDQGRD